MQKGFTPILTILIIVLISVGVGGGVYYYSEQQKQKSLNSFEECAAAGNPIMESYPAQCRTKDGRLFIQQISEEEKKKLQPQQASSVHSSGDIYPPLYLNVKWGAPQDSEMSILKEDFKIIKVKTTKISTVVLKEIPQDLIDYYIGELEKKGWSFNSNLAAGAGPKPREGGSFGYELEEHYFTISTFHVGSQENPTGFRFEIEYN